VGCAHLHRLLALELDRVDRDDTLCSGHRGALHGVDSDSTDADDNDRVTRLNVGAIGCRSPTGCHTARHQRHAVERKIGVDLDDRSFGHARDFPGTMAPAPESHRFWRPVLQ
jgi:hypothetical protein